MLVTFHCALFTALWKAGFGLFRVRSPLLAESLLFSFPPGTEMVHFPGLARTRLCIQRAVTGFFPVGFPHSDTPGSKGTSPSPRLIAGSRVLHRRLAPRHPPYALSSLTIISAQHIKNSRQPTAYSRQKDPWERSHSRPSFSTINCFSSCRFAFTNFSARIQPGQFVAAISSPLISTWHENR